MEQSTATMCRSNDQSVHLKLNKLRKEQEQYTEGSKNWSYYQNLINQIVAQNYLEYVNR